MEFAGDTKEGLSTVTYAISVWIKDFRESITAGLNPDMMSVVFAWIAFFQAARFYPAHTSYTDNV